MSQPSLILPNQYLLTGEVIIFNLLKEVSMVIKPPRITYKKVGLNPDYREQALPFDPHKLHMIGMALISLAHYQKDIIHATHDK